MEVILHWIDSATIWAGRVAVLVGLAVLAVMAALHLCDLLLLAFRVLQEFRSWIFYGARFRAWLKEEDDIWEWKCDREQFQLWKAERERFHAWLSEGDSPKKVDEKDLVVGELYWIASKEYGIKQSLCDWCAEGFYYDEEYIPYEKTERVQVPLRPYWQKDDPESNPFEMWKPCA